MQLDAINFIAKDQLHDLTCKRTCHCKKSKEIFFKILRSLMLMRGLWTSNKCNLLLVLVHESSTSNKHPIPFV